jgi:hypothetical protein
MVLIPTVALAWRPEQWYVAGRAVNALVLRDVIDSPGRLVATRVHRAMDILEPINTRVQAGIGGDVFRFNAGQALAEAELDAAADLVRRYAGAFG